MRSGWYWLCILLIIAPALGYRQWIGAQLVRADPDTIASNATLMQYGVRAGARQFAAHCAACHGARGAGDTTRGVPDLTDSDWLYGMGAVSEIERVIAYGIRSDNPKGWSLASMPAYATAHPSAANAKIEPLEPQQIRDVIDYLYYLQGRSQRSDAAARGASIFANSGACYDCHSPDARGDPAIGAPNLADRITLYGDGSREALFDSIAQGRQGVCPAWIGKLSAVAIRSTALYVYSLSRPAAPRGTDHD